MNRIVPSVLLFSILAGLPTVGLPADGDAFFEKKVRPILVKHCYECHSEKANERSGGLWLDRKAGWAEGGDSGPAIVPGKVESSLLIESIRYGNEDLQMPPESRLSAEDIAILEKWVTMGAPDPRNAAITKTVRHEAIDYEQARQGWAYRPFLKPAIPVDRDGWGTGDVDSFIVDRLKMKGLAPAEDEKPEQLLRRVHYDLTGLPPTRKEVAAFVSNPSTTAYAAVVDDLLSRRTFGEKWGRHWLDVARYADSNGGDRNFTFYQAWRYRNWVIDAFNRDVSYYDFVGAQLAGDLLPAENDEQRREQLVASTFLSLGPKMLTERDKEKLFLDTADEQIDTMGRAFLGLTLGCARCHEHKFDPVSQEDYYALAGIFRSTQVVLGTRNGCVNVASWVEQPLPLPEPQQSELQAKVDRLELVMRLKVEKQFKKKAGGRMSAMMLALAGVIYDESDVELIGKWRKSSLNPNRFGDGYVVFDRGTGPSKAVIRASLPESGQYEVRVAYSSDKSRASSVPIRVDAWKETKTVTLDQRKKPRIGGLFVPIGRFEFEKGGRANVIIEIDDADGFVILDAVQFIPVTDLKREAEALSKTELDPAFRMSDGELAKLLQKLIGELKGEELVMAPRDAHDAGDIHLRVRGEPGRKGEKIPRNFLRILHNGPAPQIPSGQSGRLQLADWMVSDSNTLLDRVIVNRVWHHLFGRGIVASVDNFGRLGQPPTHPELLDYLASSFRRSGGSLKSLVRRMVLSRVYQLSSHPGEELEKTDPQNHWFGRQNRRRLTAEEIRDSILFHSEQLDSEPGLATATPQGVDLDKPFTFATQRKRTVYLPVARNNLATELGVFDAANPDLVSGRRAQTTVPTQALYLLNSNFVHEQAMLLGKLAASQTVKPSTQKDGKSKRPASLTHAAEWLYETLLARTPTADESKRAVDLLAALTADSQESEKVAVACGHLAHVILASTEFLYLD